MSTEPIEPVSTTVRECLPTRYLGTTVDSRYRLERLIGEGASSWVFAARDARLERDVALKLLKSAGTDDEKARQKRAIAEGRTLAKLVHPHIVAVYDATEDASGQGYLVMELCEAGTLEAELQLGQPLGVKQTVELLLPLIGALAVAHERGVIHRDVKPANIVLVAEGCGRRCKLLDFGISLRDGAGFSNELLLGTPSYMAPEQARGERAIPASDVWALGVVFFRCLTGRLPFEANNATGVLLKVVQERAPRFAKVCKVLGPNLAIALDRALETDPRRRYQDMRSFAHALAAGAVLDRMALVSRPEPIGLPEFEQWLSMGTAQTTRALASPARASSAGPPQAPRRRRYAAGAALLIAGGLTVWLLTEADKTRTEVRQDNLMALPQPRPAVLGAQPIPANVPRPQVHQAASGAARNDALAVPPAAPAKAPLRARRRPSSAPSRVEPAAAEAAEPRLIKNWYW